MVQVKICGVNSPEAADAVASAGADYAGLVFFPPSPRHVRYEQAASLASRLRGRCRIVALVVDAGDAEIEAAVKAARPDLLQLHGRETPERVAAIRRRFALPVVKAVAIAEEADLVSAAAYDQVSDMLLFDAKAPANAPRPGGHGAAFDWQLLRNRRFSRPWLLGGGLTPDNVGRAIRVCGAPGVDCSSGVESAPGIKDALRIRDFLAAVHSADFVGAQA
jgi:phosphoribosylanthranilate isomerase